MHSLVKEIIEKYIHVIEQNNIEMLLYLCYRDRYHNIVVQQLRATLNKADVCSLEKSKAIAEKLFGEAFIELLKINHIHVLPSLHKFLYEDNKMPNTFGIDMLYINDFLHREQDALKIRVETDPNTYDIKVTYLGR